MNDSATTIPVSSKPCTKCGLDKSLEDFYNNPLGAYGKYARCKECHNGIMREIYTRPEVKQRRAERLASQRDHINARQRRYYKEHKEALAVYHREWNKAHPEVGKAGIHRRRKRWAQAEGHFTAKQWVDLCERYEYRCLACGGGPVTVDHVVPLSSGGTNYISNIQPLCGPCNSSKGIKIVDYR